MFIQKGMDARFLRDDDDFLPRRACPYAIVA